MLKSNNFSGSLYALAEEENVEEEIFADLKSVTLAFDEHPDYIKILDSPQIGRSDLMRILNEDFFDKIHKYTLNFIKLLCERHMVYRIGECFREYERLYNEKHNIKIVTVTTARPLTDTLAEKLSQKLEARLGGKVVLNKRVDEACMGGLVVEAEGMLMDSSIKSELSMIRNEIIS